MRLLWTLFLFWNLALAGPAEYRIFYDLLRQGLCAAGMTCALPADTLIPASYGELEGWIAKANRLVLVGSPEQLSEVFTTLAARFSGPTSAWPTVYVVTQKEFIEALAPWQVPALKNHVFVVESSNENQDPVAALGRIGLPMVIVDASKVFLPNWWILDGPITAKVVRFTNTAIEAIRSSRARKEAIR
jgi:hypothetical protein